jgi:hypothetical protein
MQNMVKTGENKIIFLLTNIFYKIYLLVKRPEGD